MVESTATVTQAADPAGLLGTALALLEEGLRFTTACTARGDGR